MLLVGHWPSGSIVSYRICPGSSGTLSSGVSVGWEVVCGRCMGGMRGECACACVCGGGDCCMYGGGC